MNDFTGKVNPEIRYTLEGEEQALYREQKSLVRSKRYQASIDPNEPRCDYMIDSSVVSICGATRNQKHSDHEFQIKEDSQ